MVCGGFYCGFGLKKCVVWLIVCCGLILSCVARDSGVFRLISVVWTGKTVRDASNWIYNQEQECVSRLT